ETAGCFILQSPAWPSHSLLSQLRRYTKRPMAVSVNYMKNTLKAIVLIFVLIGHVRGAEAEKLKPNEITPKVDQLFAPWDHPDSPGAAVVIVKDGAVVYQHGYGCADLERHVPITPQTLF